MSQPPLPPPEGTGSPSPVGRVKRRWPAVVSWLLCLTGVVVLGALTARVVWAYADGAEPGSVVLYLYLGGCGAVGLLSVWGMIRAWLARSTDWLTAVVAIISPVIVVLSGSATLVTAPIGLLAVALIVHADAGKGPGDIA